MMAEERDMLGRVARPKEQNKNNFREVAAASVRLAAIDALAIHQLVPDLRRSLSWLQISGVWRDASAR